ncbi:putative cyclin-dependent kinase F-2 [Phragmites australis]|uniref:putative cyclin-dependent kinase F-2 n=1 Tax=Phragmites australis TaxID=29695 RepID=UPI002D79E6DB|nr:putative cyclin-dependent kinase F-2 [Phragmites australis]
MALTKRPPPRSEGCSFAAKRRCGDEAPAAGIAPSAPKSGQRGVPMDSGAAAARNDDGLRIGTLKSYKLLPKIGNGAFGVVRKACDCRTGEKVAIKSVRTGGEALLREAAMLVACAGNPTVVELREVARHEETDELHLVMEYVGLSLYDVTVARRRVGRPFTEKEVRHVMRRLLGGVETMHGHDVIHCDLKPGNILVGKEDGRGRLIKICDLGLSRSMTAPPPDTTQLEGTLWYMAPEQLLGDKDIGAPIDLWALGCVMAELVSGKPIFQEYSVHEQVGKIINVLGVPDEMSLMPLGVAASTPSQLRAVVPDERLSLAGFDVLHGLLEFDPKARLTANAALRKPWFAVKDDDWRRSISSKALKLQ